MVASVPLVTVIILKLMYYLRTVALNSEKSNSIKTSENKR